jgi:FKBP-type peptidyl-prolyl cis-trans isomerase (trigger factor)
MAKTITSTIAKTDDGGVQITFSIPKSVIDFHEKHVLADLQKTATISGFRKGKAPIEKVKESTSQEKLIEQTLMHILPEAFSQAVEEHKLRPAVYPKFEMLSQDDPWQVRATTCEIVDFELGEYKKIVTAAIKDAKKEDIETKALTALLDSITLTVPQMLITEEVTMRLAQLLERIEKLGLTLEGYLSSVGKTVEGLREEYQKQTAEAIKLELILNKIAEQEKIAISEKEIDDALLASGTPEKEKEDPQRRRVLASILRRRRTLDALTSQA